MHLFFNRINRTNNEKYHSFTSEIHNNKTSLYGEHNQILSITAYIPNQNDKLSNTAMEAPFFSQHEARPMPKLTAIGNINYEKQLVNLMD